jgi:hypothetical protein
LKIHLDWSGAKPAKPDFPMLRAGIQAAQAATRTAEANERVRTRPELTEALARLFGDAAGGDAPVLGGSFNPEQAGSVRTDETR